MEEMDRLDLLIEKSLMEYDKELEIFKHFEYPDKEKVWQRILEDIENNDRQKTSKATYVRFNGWVRVAVVLLCILTVSILFSICFSGRQVNAFRQSLITSVQTIGRDVLEISFDNRQSEFIPIKIEGSLEEVLETSPIKFPLPKYLPDGYKFSSAGYSQIKPEAAHSYILYEKGAEELRIYYEYQLIDNNQDITTRAYLKESGFCEVIIDGFPVYYKDDLEVSVMVWQQGDFIITVTSDLTFEQFKKLYKSMN